MRKNDRRVLAPRLRGGGSHLITDNEDKNEAAGRGYNPPASYVALRLEILHAALVRSKATEWQTFAARSKGSRNDFDR